MQNDLENGSVRALFPNFVLFSQHFHAHHGPVIDRNGPRPELQTAQEFSERAPGCDDHRVESKARCRCAPFATGSSFLRALPRAVCADRQPSVASRGLPRASKISRASKSLSRHSSPARARRRRRVAGWRSSSTALMRRGPRPRARAGARRHTRRRHSLRRTRGSSSSSGGGTGTHLAACTSTSTNTNTSHRFCRPWLRAVCGRCVG